MMADTISRERRSWNMSRIRGKDTGPELRLRSLLHRAGYRFRLHDKTLPGKPDLVLKKHKTAIFVHGCFWHRHPGCRNATSPSTRPDFWQAKFEGTVERDRRAGETLHELGWRVLTVWECELESDAAGALKRVLEQLEGRA
jgi:DNA mismatch endonuclease (patch repair protein)